MKASERLKTLKAEAEESTTTEKFIAITNPKNITLMECVVAWTCSNVSFEGDVEVSEDATMSDMWKLCQINMQDFASTAGLEISEAIPKTKQMANLGLIYPDGTANSKAISIVKVYVSGKVKKY